MGMIHLPEVGFLQAHAPFMHATWSPPCLREASRGAPNGLVFISAYSDQILVHNSGFSRQNIV